MKIGPEAFRERLKRLLRAEDPSHDRRELPQVLARRLSRTPAALATRGDDVGPPAGLEVLDGAQGPIAARRERVPITTRHGAWRLDEITAIDHTTLPLLTGDGRLADADLTRAVFLDTETTGLGGGAGVYVFMIGLGTFAGDEFHLWQGFLREPGEEPALLAEVAARIRDAELIVSFFGKSFDRHRLEDKMRIAHVPAPFEDRPHLDLYHPLHRITRGSLPDGRLCTLEAELCGLERDDDLPGSFAPVAWFDFLSGRPHNLDGVFRHNKDDVLSLVTLSAYLGRVLDEQRSDGTALAGHAATRARGLAWAFESAGDLDNALRWIEHAIAREDDDTRELEAARAELLRRSRNDEQARAAYEAFVDGPEDPLTAPALRELAKLCEHRFRDYAAARAACERGLELATRWHIGVERDRLACDLEARLARVERKAARSRQP